MKNQYIKQVKRQLSVSRQAKKEIVRDLEEAFASAFEHGESEAQVMERLGSPKAFAASVEEQIGFDRVRYKSRKNRIRIAMCFAAAFAFFVLYLVADAMRIPENAIGQADSMTGIKLEAPLALNALSLIAILGIAAFLAAIVLTIRAIIHNAAQKEK